MAQVRKMHQTFDELVAWLRELDLLKYRNDRRYLVFPTRLAEMRLVQHGRGIHRPYKFFVGEEELCCAYPRKMRRYLLAWWAGFSISEEVNQ